MKKRYFWLKFQETAESPWQIHRFRSGTDRGIFCRGIPKIYGWELLSAIDPEVRRIQRRIAAGEQIAFPVEI